MASLEAKIVVLGAQNVGKTSLVMRYCKGTFNPSQITSTVGASFLTKKIVDFDTDTVVRLQIWDTGNISTRSSHTTTMLTCLRFVNNTPSSRSCMLTSCHSWPGTLSINLEVCTLAAARPGTTANTC
jgi:hypothetical protein